MRGAMTGTAAGMGISLRGVSATYPGARVEALGDISCDLPAGARICILGENGCGKTTLLRVLTGLLPYEGSITLDGIEVSSMRRTDIASRVALMAQISPVYFAYTVRGPLCGDPWWTRAPSER